MDKKPTITLCMIVKNEDAFLEKCLSSVQDFVDEIIIVDTGSTDQTILIANQFHAKVYHYLWDDHFANARNTGLAKATGEWILWLDADECLDVQNPEGQKIALKKKTANILSLPITNFIGEHINDSNQASYMHYQPRLFRNHCGITFIHRIHETLDGDPSQMTTDTLKLPILHYGYIREITIQKNKSARNRKLLELEAEKAQHSPWIEYHLASEYYRNHEYDQAMEYVNRSIFNFLLSGQKPPSILYKLKYDMLIQTNSLDQALPGIEKALLLYPDYVDLHFYKGLILFRQADFQDAKACFEKCLELGENHPGYLILQGVGSFRAEQYRDTCLDQLKESNEGGAS
ncbi:glycosyltransferase family 2 protein [Oceanobacillus sp. CFH 90083]|uniref:glycosyltransferase family 2 protein n=1 Tax=Oceanobacillus sp. CFH 90083 TaxID=2592336 RepID=UPI001D14C615|nr:glycosyltransferase family 2 protein [Oceanobacillus sp. CFH 90083]